MPKDKRPLPKTIPLNRLRAALKAESSDGLKLLKDIKNNPLCSVFVMENVPCVAVVWKGYVTSIQLRYIHENILHLLKRHGLSKVLGDDTALPTIHEDDQKWIVENWIPRAIEAGLKVAASINALSYYGKLSTDYIKSVAPKELVIASFDDLENAEQWLKC